MPRTIKAVLIISCSILAFLIFSHFKSLFAPNPNISGGFGVTFGESLPEEIIEEILSDEKHSYTVKISPPVPNKNFEVYYASVSKSEIGVYQIFGETRYKGWSVCWDTAEVLIELLEQKYGKFEHTQKRELSFSKSGGISQVPWWTYTYGNIHTGKAITLDCDGSLMRLTFSANDLAHADLKRRGKLLIENAKESREKRQSEVERDDSGL